MADLANSDSIDPESLCLAYLSCPLDSAKGYVGALLITDAHTRPLHFGYVAPVRPTTMQRILYGRTLEAHIKIDVVTTKLAKDWLPRVPDILFVDTSDLLNARSVFGVPTAQLSKKEPVQGGVSLSPFMYDTGGNLDDEHHIGKVVAALEQSIDLLDPFQRMQEALKEALKEIGK